MKHPMHNPIMLRGTGRILPPHYMNFGLALPMALPKPSAYVTIGTFITGRSK